MNKLDNLEKIIEYVEKAYYELKEAEESWEENVLSEEIEDKIVEMKEELEEILYSLRRRMEKLEDENF
jgi:hypothetical protein